MYDKIIGGAIIAGGVVVAGVAAWWAYKKWKEGVRDEVRAWIQAHPKTRLRSISLRIVDMADGLATGTESFVRYRLVGQTATGQIKKISEKNFTAEEVRQRGLWTDSGPAQEKEVFNDNEILAMMTA